ncbi:UNVERIFIED_ORG: hypothetical protein FNL38_10364 [Nocardia globerula]|uniref:Uncharacterized protein n=1 Tax=Nocardia globerula TaxID=1818 RepID=A0A652YQ78_NOCGL|nr:hypothetical protein C8E04_0511 [Rhodococcus globerulus]
MAIVIEARPRSDRLCALPAVLFNVFWITFGNVASVIGTIAVTYVSQVRGYWNALSDT